MGDFLYICDMKDLSNYISSILDDGMKIDADYKVVWYDEGTYVIKIRVKDYSFITDLVRKHINMSVDEVLDTYFPKGSIQYVVNVLYYLA
jgi:hypothetical protein